MRWHGMIAVVATVVFASLALHRPVWLDGWLAFPLDVPGWRYEAAAKISHVLAFGVAPTVWAGVAWVTFRRRDRRGLAGLAMLHLAWMGTRWVWKPLVGRERPWSADLDSFAFPSGHVTTAVALTGSLLFLGPSKGRIALVVVVGGATAWYRVAGAVHWPSDTIGAMAWATLVIIGALQVAGKVRWTAPAAHRFP